MNAPLHLCPRLQRLHDISWEDVLLLEGRGNYTLIHLHGGQKILTSKTLKLFDGLVPTQRFWRINKTYLIRPEQIVEWQYTSDKLLRLTLASGQVCEVSRRRRVWVKRQLNGGLIVGD